MTKNIIIAVLAILCLFFCWFAYLQVGYFEDTRQRAEELAEQAELAMEIAEERTARLRICERELEECGKE